MIGRVVQDADIMESFLLPVFMHECGVHVGLYMSACVGHVGECTCSCVHVHVGSLGLVLVIPLTLLPLCSLKQHRSVKPRPCQYGHCHKLFLESRCLPLLGLKLQVGHHAFFSGFKLWSSHCRANILTSEQSPISQ